MINNNWRLFESTRIGNLLLKNRLVMLPMGNKLHGPKGEVTSQLIRYYQERAKGGVGLIIVQVSMVSGDFESSRLNISSDDYVAGLSDLAESIKSFGALVAIQLGHRGFRPGVKRSINELKDYEIEKLIESFGKAGERAKRAGFDAVEIHAGHGYLIAQFLSELTNKRKDAYGGSPEERMTFPLKVYRKIQEAVGNDFPIFLRISGNEFVSGGITIHDAKNIASTFEREGIDLISVSAGKGPETREWVVQPMALPRGCLVNLSKEIKDAVKIPILAAGRINDPILANSIIEEGKADLIGLGRGLVADPWFPRKALSGELHTIRKCIACNCCHRRVDLELPIRCAINPQAGRERVINFTVKKNRKKVVVIGGGPAGLECAHVLSQGGNEVLLFEKDPYLGGKLNIAALPPQKDELNELLNYMINRIKQDKVSVFLNNEADLSTIKDINPDTLVLASGSKPVYPPIPGLKESNHCTAEEALIKPFMGNQIVIIGGGSVGCEVADFWGSQCKKIVIIEKLPFLCPDSEPLSKKLLLNRLMAKGVTIFTSSEITNINSNQIDFKDEEGIRHSSFETIVVAAGYTPDNNLADSVNGLVSEIYSIGDCNKPRGIYEAIHEGNRIGQTILQQTTC